MPADAINKDYVLRTELRMRPAVPGLDLCTLAHIARNFGFQDFAVPRAASFYIEFYYMLVSP